MDALAGIVAGKVPATRQVAFASSIASLIPLISAAAVFALETVISPPTAQALSVPALRVTVTV